MPELPEVEVVKQSLDKKIKEKKVKKVLVRNRNLRKKVPLNFENFFLNQKILEIERFSNCCSDRIARRMSLPSSKGET